MLFAITFTAQLVIYLVNVTHTFVHSFVWILFFLILVLLFAWEEFAILTLKGAIQEIQLLDNDHYHFDEESKDAKVGVGFDCFLIVYLGNLFVSVQYDTNHFEEEDHKGDNSEVAVQTFDEGSVISGYIELEESLVAKVVYFSDLRRQAKNSHVLHVLDDCSHNKHEKKLKMNVVY